ncbi:hypothetical protein ACIQ7N_01335 [Lysinibacillus sp. NPDC095746]|uniref:hypothetical protein n=1 Tax=Lysinibacillus sp. NPDC095746 TaxID=3364134 RepID=UPI0038291FDE
MTKTTKKQLIEEYIQKAEELKQQAKQLQARTISETREEYHKVKIDARLSPEGKHFENEAIRQFYAERFLREMDVIRTKYDKYVADAKKFALEVVSTPIEFTGSAAQKAAFESKLRDLKVRTALIPDQKSAAEEIEKFVRSQSDAYFAQQVALHYSDLIAPFTNTPSADIKTKLAQAYEMAKHNATTDETRYAQQVLDIEDNKPLVLTITQSQSFQSLQSVIGRRAAKNANDPQAELARLAAGDTDEKSKHSYGEFEEETEQTE